MIAKLSLAKTRKGRDLLMREVKVVSSMQKHLASVAISSGDLRARNPGMFKRKRRADELSSTRWS